MLFSVSDRVNGLTFNYPLWEVRAAATHKPKIMELAVTFDVASPLALGIGRPAAIGSGVTDVKWGSDEEMGTQTSLTTFVRIWATPPTLPTTFLRRTTLNGANGVTILWIWPRGLGIPASGSVVVWNLATNSAPDVYVNAVVSE